MLKKKSRIVIDTNIWISFLLTKDFSLFDKIVSNPNLILVFSAKLLEEFIEVAGRPKFKRYFSSDDLEELLFQMREHGEFITVTTSTNICRDPKDNKFLELAVACDAQYIVTGDDDLLVLNPYRGITILKSGDFLALELA